ncbi:MAG: ribosome-associated translation inhibitor RaiA [Alphaproteobacteria bacterium]|nr:MAG: ribosome-associated translation inhibitor RaiA [Alphaproteobacteria bacterium]
MKIIVSGHKVDVGTSLTQHVEEKLAGILSKYIDRINMVNVVFSKEGHAFRADITSNIGTHAHITLQARMEAADAYTAFDAAADKVAKQLRRYKRQITNHHSRIHEKELALHAMMHYVIDAEDESDEKGDNPLIIAEDTSHLEHLTVPDAVMRMDLGDLPALMFINDATEVVNVIYRRPDGNIAWLAPHATVGAYKKSAAA